MHINVSMNASEIITKKVYSIYEGNEIGYILNFSLNDSLTKLTHLIVASLYEEEELVLCAEDIVTISEEGVFVKSEKVLSFNANASCNNPIGKKIFSVDGESMGVVRDAELDGFQVKKIIGSICEVLSKNIFSSGQDCLFFSKKRIKKSKIFEKKDKIPVNIQEINLPFKEKSQGINLIGKKLNKNILDSNHILLLKKNTIITPKILIEAQKAGILKKISECCE